MVEGAQTYTATYSSVKNQYEVIFQNEDGTELQRSNVTYGETPVYAGATPEKAATAEFTYTFAGWSPSITAVEGAQTYTATYSSVKNQYEVIFQNEDGTELQRSNVTYGETPVYNGETPTKAATAEFTYAFKGWSPSITVVEGKQTYKATYTATRNKYKLEAKPEDEKMGEVTGSGIYEYGTKVTVTATKKYGYDFYQWSNGLTSPTISIKIVSDSTVIALYKENYCEQHVDPVIPAITILPQAAQGKKLKIEEADIAMEIQLDNTKKQNWASIKDQWWEILVVDKWQRYTQQNMPKQDSIQVRYALKTICNAVVEGEAVTIPIEVPNPQNSKECANAPAVNKYDWLLMLNVNAIKAQGYQFAETDVIWYKQTENGEAQPVGTGYSYTIDRSLLGTGSYYAEIHLPVQTSDVGCKGILGTQVFDFEAEASIKPALIPTIVAPYQPVDVVNLPLEENAEIKVYDHVGKLYYIIQTNGQSKVAFESQALPGKYIVEIQSKEGKISLKYIVR
jgi:hypothetical protein